MHILQLHDSRHAAGIERMLDLGRRGRCGQQLVEAAERHPGWIHWSNTADSCCIGVKNWSRYSRNAMSRPVVSVPWPMRRAPYQSMIALAIVLSSWLLAK